MIANTKKELQKKLRGIDITVPPRGEGRKSEHCERWSICHFLASMSESEKLSYPLHIVKRPQNNSPDYQLIMGKINIGIEVTEAIPEDLAQFEAKNQNVIIDLSLFKPDMKPKSTKELRSIANSKTHGEGWDGEEQEIDWAKTIYKSIDKKTNKLKEPHFEKFTHNWLLIYDNLLPAENKKIDFLSQMLITYWGDSNFDSIFIESSEILIRISENNEIIPLFNLWQKTNV